MLHVGIMANNSLFEVDLEGPAHERANWLPRTRERERERKRPLKVFELILRLKGNYLWPAMWGNAFIDDDPRNAQLADEYGIVMGTSHHEPMLRAQQEWKRYGSGEWNYETNAAALQAFWRQGIRNMGSRESIVTIGMRGDGDMPMSQQNNRAFRAHLAIRGQQRAHLLSAVRRCPTR